MTLDTSSVAVPGVLRGFSLSWWPNQEWSIPDLCPSSIRPLFVSGNAQPSWSSLCSFGSSLGGLPFPSSSDAQEGIDLAQWLPCKAPPPHLNWHTLCMPPPTVTFLHQFRIFLPLPLTDLLHSLLPRQCQLQHNDLFRWAQYLASEKILWCFPEILAVSPDQLSSPRLVPISRSPSGFSCLYLSSI